MSALKLIGKIRRRDKIPNIIEQCSYPSLVCKVLINFIISADLELGKSTIFYVIHTLKCTIASQKKDKQKNNFNLM
jgi:hypothetical protein